MSLTEWAAQVTLIKDGNYSAAASVQPLIRCRGWTRGMEKSLSVSLVQVVLLLKLNSVFS